MSRGLGDVYKRQPLRGGSRDPSGVGHVTPHGWVTRPLSGGSGDPSRLGHQTPQGWVTRPLRGGSRDSSGVGHVTPQGWVTRPLRCGSRDPSGVGDLTPQGWVRRLLKGGSRDPREACGGEPECAAPPTDKPEPSQPRLGEKPSPGGLTMFFHSSSVTPLRMEEKGDLRSGGFGPEGSAGFSARRPGARTTGPGV